MSDTAVLAVQAPAVEGKARPGAAALAARLATLDLPAPGFGSARAEAAQRLDVMGLPGARDEYWRYTDPAPFNAARPAATNVPAREANLFADVDRLRLVFVDGVFDPQASDALEGEGLEIAMLSDAHAPDWAEALYGRLEAAGQVPVKRPFAALNTLAARHGALIRVTGKPSRPVHLFHCRSEGGADVMLHHLVRLEPGAELTLLETGGIGARSNTVIEVDLADGARFHHIASKRADDPKLGIGHIFARLGRQALFKSFALSVNGLMMRNEAVISIEGNDSVAHIAAAVLGDGEEGPFHHDDTVFITHAAERCESRQVFKKVLKNGAQGVFQGKILVKPGAQKTDGYQISQGLLLDEGSQFLAKPELEIYADDVKCSHGSTTGALDETALFYLRSRGVPRAQAVVLLVLSFLADALDEIEDESLRDQILGRLDEWLLSRATA
ncbi:MULTISPECIES: SufB/SufD family protein [unclassified Paracoccus (in: a-proteobacteria)]|uniref:SufB/SufD family protein n=1 Tax=unclassified Paracoccus (in: a-proteobacteria) TaxID=2688777 RepID=UPI0012B31E66|nr:MULTISPECIES: SufD family Fe-S cluster assembly protein [unclassified Paracoccus (in: a-proteobacteria)]UXU74090.1 SufD family Fe-S cluster assembly protein [Paracoccus sp. SMMA_5]UXU79980.1 SufD family Fe-S cluster assembly protein [Paracoccus sp. SMMA_5_TC]